MGVYHFRGEHSIKIITLVMLVTMELALVSAVNVGAFIYQLLSLIDQGGFAQEKRKTAGALPAVGMRVTQDINRDSEFKDQLGGLSANITTK